MKIIAIALFLLTYVLLIALPRRRPYVALVSGGLFILLGILPLGAVFGAIDWNVIMMIAGTMGIVALFIESRMPALLADILIEHMPNVLWAVVSLALFASIISAFIDNVATVLIVAPIAITIAKKLGTSPVMPIIAISVASNLQGAATLVGDTTSILLGGYAGMDFLDFFYFQGRMGIFWVVQIGAIASTFVLIYLFRKEKQPIAALGRVQVKDIFPTVLILAMVLLLILASFVPNTPATINGLITMSLFGVALLREGLVKKNKKVIRHALREIDYFTILLLMGLFLVIGGLSQAGVVEDIAALFVRFSGDNVFLIYTVLVWASVLFSAFIDNIPYVATMLPVVAGIASLLGIEPYLLYFGLITGATLGGNLTPIGASANITGIGILRRYGHEVRTKDFMKVGVPFTLVAVFTGYILIWMIWS